MATIGLDRLYYAKITENDAGEETYGTPEQLAKAISADLSVELAEATLYADDGASEIVKEFKSGTLSLALTISALRRHPTSQVRPSAKTRCSFPHPRTAATLWRWASAPRNPTASTSITGCTA